MERVLFAPREPPPLRPDVSEDPRPYDAWARAGEGTGPRHPLRATATAPLALLMLLGAAPSDDLRRTLDGLAAQSDSGWSLILVTPEPWSDASRALVSGHRRARRRTSVVSVRDGAAACDLLAAGLPGEGDATVALLFAGDVWAPSAVARLRGALEAHGAAYADEDTLDGDGHHVLPVLKPDYSPDFLLSSAYVGRPFAFRARLLRDAAFVAKDLSELEHECALAACETAESVAHIPEVLCHRTGAPTPALNVDHVRAALRRREDPSTVRPGHAPGTFQILRTAPHGVAVSVVVPFRDQPRFLRTCVDSVRATSLGADIELLLVDNGSCEPETATLLEALAASDDVRILPDPRPFNWAELNNAAARTARGDILVFLNNDIEAHRDGWLGALCAQALRPDVGAVGARLLYPDRRLQHCGIVVGLTGAAGHPLAGLTPGREGYLHMANAARECSAVTGACLATRREVFERLGGFDESLGVDLNDVDYCLRAWQHGYRVVYEPGAELIHYESPSRGTAGGVGDTINFVTRWQHSIDAGDPYLNPRLTREDASCAFAGPDEKEAWSTWHSTLVAT